MRLTTALLVFAVVGLVVAGVFALVDFEPGVTVSLIFPDFVATETRYQAFGADGAVVGESHVQEGEIMSARACARIMLKDMAQRKRQDLMSLRGKLGQWVKLIAPGLVDNIARRAIEKGK